MGQVLTHKPHDGSVIDPSSTDIRVGGSEVDPASEPASSSLAPFQVFYGRWASRHPVCVRESLEAALWAIPAARWWEIKDRSGRVVASHSVGIAVEIVPRPSLVARQILSTLPMVGSSYESVGEIEVDSSAWTGTDTDGVPGENGVRWTKLPETKSAPKPNGAARSWPKTRGASPPVSFEIESQPHSSVISVTIRHRTGWLRVLDHRFLELRNGKLGRDGVPRWDLVVLNARDDGMPGETAKGTAVEGLGLEEFVELGSIGVAVREPRDPSAPPKTWKPGMVRTATAAAAETVAEGESEGEDKGTESTGAGPVVERPGWVRGCYGIDKRSVKIEGYGGFSYRQMRYHLTHLPTGCLILHAKRKSTAKAVADTLVEEMPELSKLTTGELRREEGIGRRVAELIQAMKDEAKWHLGSLTALPSSAS